MKKSYRAIHQESIDIENNLVRLGIIPEPIKGRFKDYQKIISNLADLWEQKDSKKTKLDEHEVLALKELREIADVFSVMMSSYAQFPDTSKKIINSKLRTILSGPLFTKTENTNTIARDFQFEFRLASKLIEAGMNVTFFENPDICIDVYGRRYAVECKRIVGTSNRTIMRNIDEAVEQLIKHKEYYYGGLVALDITALLDRRTDLLVNKSVLEADREVMKSINKMIVKDFRRSQKLATHSHTHIIGLLYNFSGSYVVPNDVGWIQETGILVFDGENPKKAKKFTKDFNPYKDQMSFKNLIEH